MRTVVLYELLPFAVSICGCEDTSFRGVFVDSRRYEEGGLFAALPGEKTDGHCFISDLISAGIRAFLISEKYAAENHAQIERWTESENAAFLISVNPLETLQKAARWYLDQMPQVQRVGITGSSGKTTTKELIASVLRRQYRVAYTRGNLNSEIGLPLVAFSVDPDDEIAVFEMGINHPGEMDILVDIVRPQTAVITNIALAHAGMFSNPEEIVREKMKIFSRAGEFLTAFVNSHDDRLSFYRASYPGNYIVYGMGATGDVAIADNLGWKGWRIRIGDSEIETPLFGEYNLENICAAVAVGRSFGVNDAEIAEGIAAVNSVGFGRGCLKTGRINVVEDCYNANPGSVAAAVDLFRCTPVNGRKIFVLGAMRELGDFSESLHREIGVRLAQSGMDAVLFFGQEAEPAFDAYKKNGGRNGFFTPDYKTLERRLSGVIESGDTVFLKGSRSLQLERLESVLQ